MKFFLTSFFYSEAMAVSAREKILSGVVALFTLLAVGMVSISIVGIGEGLFMAASVGATVTLIAALPASPLSQPWPLIGGSMISAVIGVSVALLVPNVTLAAALAVSIAIVVMYFSHCLHPPGGAVALAAVLSPEAISQLGFGFVLAPVGINVLMLLLSAMVLNNLIPSRRYPSWPLSTKKSDLSLLSDKSLLHTEDFISALQQKDSFVDVGREDLEDIYQLAVLHANKRRLGQVLGKDIMTEDVLSFEYSDPLEQAWKELKERKLKGAPIRDRFGYVIGVMTIQDMVSHAMDQQGEGFDKKIRKLIKTTPGHYSDKPEVVGQVMSNPPITTEGHVHIVDLVPVFTRFNIHHLPVLGEDRKLIGMITRSDLLRALLVARL